MKNTGFLGKRLNRSRFRAIEKTELDGIIYIKAGVEDLEMPDNKKYMSACINLGDKYIVTGMAVMMYNADLFPDGVDVLYHYRLKRGEKRFSYRERFKKINHASIDPYKNLLSSVSVFGPVLNPENKNRIITEGKLYSPKKYRNLSERMKKDRVNSPWFIGIDLYRNISI